MPELGEAYTILETLGEKGPIQVYQVDGPAGPGKVYWFEVRDPESRAIFYRYRNALKRLEKLGALPPGVEIGKRPGRHFVYWPEPGEAPRPNRWQRRRLSALEATLAPLGYSLKDARVGLLGHHLTLLDLPPTTEATPPASGGHRPLRRDLRQLLGAFLLLLIGAGLWTLGLERYFNPPSFVLPDLHGKPVAEALTALKGKGLWIIFEEKSDPEAPTGIVLKTLPPPGTRLKPGRQVHVVVNTPKVQVVPSLLKMPLKAARTKLADAGLRLGQVARAYASAPEGTVLASRPPAGVERPAGSPIDLVVSAGPAPQETLVPDLHGVDPAEAERLLALAGLKVQREETVPAPLPEGQLIAEAPRPGTPVETETPLVLSRARRPEVELPPLLTPTSEPAPAPNEPAPPPEAPPATGGPSVPLRLTLPPELEGKRVRLVVEDAEGRRVLYEGPTQKGWTFEGEIPIHGDKATFRLYVGDHLYQTWEAKP